MSAANNFVRGFRAAIVALVLILTTSARAHDPGLSTATITVRPDRCNATLVFSIASARMIVDAHPTFEGKLDENGVTRELEKIASGSIELNFDGTKPAPMTAHCISD